MGRPRVVFFSGLGCDERMIAGNRAIAADAEFVPWMEPVNDAEPLASYAARMANAIDASTPFYLAGVSLGGMVALEVAARVPTLGVILIASCRGNRGIPAYARLGAWLAGRSPLWVIRVGRWSLPHMRRFFGIMDERQVELFASMLAAADPRFIRWSLRAVEAWPGRAESDATPVFQVHGRRDHVLPLRLAGAVDVVVEEAGHALNVSHADAVNRAINVWLASQVKPPPVDLNRVTTSHANATIRDRKEHPMPAMPAVGTKAPTFTLPDSVGRTVRLDDYLGKSPIVVYFYPKADTPGCTKEACGFRDAIASYAKLNIPVFGISPDPVADVKQFSDKFALNFPLLADADHAVSEAYGCWGHRGIWGMGTSRTTFVIGADGNIAHVFDKVNAEGHDQEVLGWLQSHA